MDDEPKRQKGMQEVLRRLGERLSDPNDLPELASFDNRKHIFSWTRPFWTVAFCELFNAWILLAWGLQMVVVVGLAVAEPVSRALHEFTGLAPLHLGCLMIFLSCLQMFGLFWWNRHARLMALFTSITIFLFFAIAFVRNLPHYPGAFIVPTYCLAAIVRFVQLAGRKD